MKKLVVLMAILTTTTIAMAAETCIVDYNASEQVVTCSKASDENVALPKYEYSVNVNTLKVKVIKAMQSRGYDFKSAEGYNLFFVKP